MYDNERQYFISQFTWKEDNFDVFRLAACDFIVRVNKGKS